MRRACRERCPGQQIQERRHGAASNRSLPRSARGGRREQRPGRSRKRARSSRAPGKSRRRTTVLFETGYGPSGLPHIGTFGEVARTTMVRHAFRVLTARRGGDQAAVLLRRHGRDAQDPRQRAGPRLPGAASAQAADLGAEPVRRRLRELRPPQQRDAAALPRHVRLRLRVRQRDRLLQVRPLRRDPQARRRALRRHHGDHAADAGRGAPGDLFARSCRSRRRPAACSTCR